MTQAMTKKATNWMPAVRHRRSQLGVLMRVSLLLSTFQVARLAEGSERRSQLRIRNKRPPRLHPRVASPLQRPGRGALSTASRPNATLTPASLPQESQPGEHQPLTSRLAQESRYTYSGSRSGSTSSAPASAGAIGGARAGRPRMVVVAFLAARVVGLVDVTITSTPEWTSSVASSGRRLILIHSHA